MNTIGKTTGAYPTNEWKRKLLMSEHSPIRRIKIYWRWKDIKYWVSVHIVRHKIGIEHWVTTQRTDRTGVNRDESTQESFVNHACEADAQALINMSRKRLCYCASKETSGYNHTDEFIIELSEYLKSFEQQTYYAESN